MGNNQPYFTCMASCDTYVVLQVYYICRTCALHMYLVHMAYTCVLSTHIMYVYAIHLNQMCEACVLQLF